MTVPAFSRVDPATPAAFKQFVERLLNGDLAFRRVKIAGPLETAIRTVAANATIVNTDSFVLVDATGAVRTITLPRAAAAKGRWYGIKKIDASANAVNVASVDNIDGITPQVLNAQFQSLWVQSDGVTWWVQ